MEVDETKYYSSAEPLQTSRVRHHQIGVTIHSSFISRLDGREYVDIQVDSIDTWSIPYGHKVRIDNWKRAVANDTQKVIEGIDGVIKHLEEHRSRLLRELMHLHADLCEEEEEE